MSNEAATGAEGAGRPLPITTAANIRELVVGYEQQMWEATKEYSDKGGVEGYAHTATIAFTEGVRSTVYLAGFAVGPDTPTGGFMADLIAAHTNGRWLIAGQSEEGK